MTESRIEKLTRIGQEMAAAVAEMRADAADVTSQNPETAALVEELSVTCDRWSQWEEVAAVALTHLQSAGRLVPAGGMALTAEPVEDVRIVLGLNGSQDIKVVLDAQARLRALFPATEPAEEVKPVHPRPNVGDWGYGGGAAVYAPEVRCKTREELLSEKVEQLQAQVKHLSRVAVNAAEHGIPAPAEPAEEETKAERDSEGIIRINGGRIVALSRDPRELVQQWFDLAEPGSKWQRDYAAALDLFDREAASSPVVPAPTETGPWQTLAEIPASVTRIMDRGHWIWTRIDADEWRCGALTQPSCLAPFVASEEG